MTGDNIQQFIPDEDIQRSVNMDFEKLKEEFSFILKYEQEDARTLSVPYDPESQEFESGDEPFPYSDGEIFDSDESANLEKVVDSYDGEENIPLFDGGDNGSLTSLNTNKVCNHRSIVVNSDSEHEEVDDLATLELRKAALASLASKLESVSIRSRDGIGGDSLVTNKTNEDEISFLTYKAASTMLCTREPLSQYKVFFDLLLSSTSTNETHWNDSVYNLQVKENGFVMEETERFRRTSRSQLNCEPVDTSTSDCHLEKSMDQWIIIDEADSTDASSTVSDSALLTLPGVDIGKDLNVGNKTDASSRQEDVLSCEVLLHPEVSSEEMEETDLLRKQLLMSIAKKRLPAPQSFGTVYASDLAVQVEGESISTINTRELNCSVSESANSSSTDQSAPKSSVDRLKNGAVFLSSRKTDGPSRRFVIQVGSESSEDDAAKTTVPLETNKSSCSLEVTSFIQHMRRQTNDISKLKSAPPAHPAQAIEAASRPSAITFSTSELAFLRRKLSQEQFTLIRDEAALQLQQRTLARLKFIHQQRLHKQNKLLRAFRSNQVALEEISKRVNDFKTALVLHEKRVQQRRLGHARNKTLMLRLQRLRSAQSLVASGKSTDVAPTLAPAPALQNGRQVQQRSAHRKRVRSRTDSLRRQQQKRHMTDDGKPSSLFDPFVPICPYFLHGKCKETGCEFQHPGPELGFRSLTAKFPLAPPSSSSSTPSPAVATALELPEYSSINEHDLSLKLGLVVRTWCRACRCFISVPTQHLRSAKRCTACVASAGQSESAWLAVLHHVLCRADALRNVAADSNAAQDELLCGAEIADRALQLLPESVPLIQHSLILRRLSRSQDVPLTLLKALLMRTKRVCILWQCAQLVSAEVWPHLLQFVVRLSDVRFEEEEDRLALILAVLRVEEDTRGPGAALCTLRELLAHDSCAKWPLVEQLTLEQRAALWLCVVHLTVHEHLPVIDSTYKIDLSQMEPIGSLARADAPVHLKELLHSVLYAAQTDCFSSLESVAQLRAAGRFCSALQLLACVLWDARLIEYVLWKNLPRKWSTTLVRWATACTSQEHLHAEDIEVRWYCAEQAALGADWQLTLDTLDALVRDLMGSSFSDGVSTMDILACFFSVENSALEKSKRGWITREDQLDRSASAEAMLCSVPLLLQRALFELRTTSAATPAATFISMVEVLRTRAVATGNECVLFLSAALRWWCSPLMEQSSLTYEDFVRSAWRASTLSGRAADVVSVINATRPELLGGASVRLNLAEDILDRIPQGSATAVLSLSTLIDWLAAQDGPSYALLLCQHCLMSPMATTSPSSSLVWRKTMQLVTAASWSSSRRLDLLSRATSLLPLSRSLWLIYKNTAQEAGRPKLVQYVIERMSALNLCCVEDKQVAQL